MDYKSLIRVLVSLVGIVALNYGASPAKADIQVYGDDWLKDSGGPIPNGVPVCNPQDTGATCDGQQPIDVYPWQCAELAQRLYTLKGWDTDETKTNAPIVNNGYIFRNTPGAADIFSEAEALGFEAVNNGSITEIEPGDMIIHNRTDPNLIPDANGATSGHVAIVDTVVGSTVNAREQNWSRNGTSKYQLDRITDSISRILPGSSSATYILGLVHSPLNVGNRLAVTALDFTQWCIKGGADEVRLVDDTNQPAYKLACYNRGVPSPPAIDMVALCQARYPGLNYIDLLGDIKDPLSWRCFGPAEPQGGLNLQQYCVDQGYSNVSLPGKTVDDWSCVGADGSSYKIHTYLSVNPPGNQTLSMVHACSTEYNLPVIRARIANYNDPNSVQCWGSRQAPPQSPSNVSSQISSNGAGIGVSWAYAAQDVAGFDIYYYPQGKKNTTKHMLVGPNQGFMSAAWGLTYDQNGSLLPHGQTMCFQVSSFNSAGSSPPAPTAASCLTVP